MLFNRATEGARRLRPEYRTMNQWLEVKPDSYTVYGCILSLAPVEHVATEGREGRGAAVRGVAKQTGEFASQRDLGVPYLLYNPVLVHIYRGVCWSSPAGCQQR